MYAVRRRSKAVAGRFTEHASNVAQHYIGRRQYRLDPCTIVKNVLKTAIRGRELNTEHLNS